MEITTSTVEESTDKTDTLDMRALLKKAKEKDASDLHIIAGVPPGFRTRGELRPEGKTKLMPEITRDLIYQVFTEEQRKTFEKQGYLDFSFSFPGVGRFRVNAHLQRGSVAAAFRLIPINPPPFSELGLPEIILDLALRPKGLVLITGPTGSGKSTTLASMIDNINEKRAVHIITIEDPIEYLHSHKKAMVEQIEVGMDIPSFPLALKLTLRQDPDVILIGEMRDLETIATAITAAETGHLVLATLHTQDAPQTINRIIDVFPPHQQSQIRVQLASALQGIIAQTLLPRKDKSGRIAALEIMINTPAVANLIRGGKTHQLYTNIQTGAQYGMRLMDDVLRKLVKKGVVSAEDALEKASNREALERSLGGLSQHTRAKQKR